MAQIKITELNELEIKQNNDVLPIVDISENETKKIKVQDLVAKNKSLIAVIDEEPTEFNEGDKYYNTETRLIYTALNSETWSTDGEVPEEGIMYVVFNEKDTFAWNGSDLISVGGGSGSEIVIGDESEITEDTKLLIEDEDLEPQGLEIVNEYNNANNMAYSCEYVNRFGKLLWQGNFTSGSITVPGSTDYSVFIVQVLGLVFCIGSRSYGGGIVGSYQSYSNEIYTYRVGGSGDTWTISADDKGGSNGTSNVPITAIFGLF